MNPQILMALLQAGYGRPAPSGMDQQLSQPPSGGFSMPQFGNAFGYQPQQTQFGGGMMGRMRMMQPQYGGYGGQGYGGGWGDIVGRHMMQRQMMGGMGGQAGYGGGDFRRGIMRQQQPQTPAGDANPMSY